MVRRCRFDGTHGLGHDAIAAFIEDGIVVIEGFAPPTDCDALRRHAHALAAEHAARHDSRTHDAAAPSVFSTRDQRHARDAAFEASANGIDAFFEEEAFDAEGRLCVPLDRAINKIGHALHDLDPLLRDFSRGPRLQAVAQSLGLPDALLIQSMLIFKPPGIGGEVSCHQDASYIGTEPESVLGFWFALDDASRTNGCLGALPGQHRRGLRERFARQADGRFVLQTLQADLHWPLEQVEWIEAAQGTLIVFDGHLPHCSEANRSDQARLSYTLHAVSASANYRADNWIQRVPGHDAPWRGFV